MKIKIGDKVVPSHQLGRVVSIKDTEVIIEVPAKENSLRYVKITKQHADTRGVSLEELVNTSLVIVTSDA